nr:hypothetical protein CFP56_31733 [Quercus suber]
MVEIVRGCSVRFSPVATSRSHKPHRPHGRLSRHPRSLGILGLSQRHPIRVVDWYQIRSMGPPPRLPVDSFTMHAQEECRRRQRPGCMSLPCNCMAPTVRSGILLSRAVRAASSASVLGRAPSLLISFVDSCGTTLSSQAVITDQILLNEKRTTNDHLRDRSNRYTANTEMKTGSILIPFVYTSQLTYPLSRLSRSSGHRLR